MDPFSLDEILMAAQKMKSKKSCGLDGIPSCVIKDSMPELETQYLKIFNSILLEGLPEAWRTAVVSPTHKKGPTTALFRTSPLLESCSKNVY